MFKLILPILWLLIVLSILWFGWKGINAFIYWLKHRKKEVRYEIGKRGRVNDAKFGDVTVYTPNVGGRYLSFVLLPDEFWYPIVDERGDAVLFKSESVAQQTAVKIMATEGHPIVLSDDQIGGKPDNGLMRASDLMRDIHEQETKRSRFMGGPIRS